MCNKWDKKINEFCNLKDNFKYPNHLNITTENCELKFYFYHFRNKDWESNVIYFDQQKNN